MRRTAAICLMLLTLLLPCPAQTETQAQRESEAAQPSTVTTPGGWAKKAVVVTQTSDGAAPMYAMPQEGSCVLMTYYSGAPLEVLRAAGSFYLVQAGTDAASLMGYMRAEDVLIGDTAQRQVQPCYMKLEFNRETPVYAYCDEGAQVIGMCDTSHTYYAMSKNDGMWVQLFLPPAMHVWEEENRIACGFVKLETGMARGYWQELESWAVEPAAEEMDRNEVIDRAIAILESAYGRSNIPEVYTIRERLEQMGRRALLRRMLLAEGEPDWWVYFWEKPGSDAVQVHVSADGSGDHCTYISPEDWSSFSITPML